MRRSGTGVLSRLLGATTLVLFALPAHGVAAGLGVTSWPMFQHDLQHTGQAQVLGPSAATLHWRQRGPGKYKGSPAIGADGTVYAGVGFTPICAFDPDSGTKKWCSKRSGDVSHSVPAPAIAADGTVYLGARDNRLWSIDGGTGATHWSYLVRTDGDVTGSPAIAPDGTVFTTSACPTAICPFTTIPAGDGLVLAIHPDGTLLWQAAIFGVFNASPALSHDAGTVYIATKDGALHALSAAGDGHGNGVELWSASVGTSAPIRFTPTRERVSSPVVAADGTIYVGAVGGVWAVRASDGNVLWSFATAEGIVLSTPALDAAGNLYFGTTGKTFYKIDSATHTAVWQRTGLDAFQSSPALDSAGNVYVGSGKQVLALDGQSGATRWSFSTTRAVISSPALGANHLLYISGQDGYIYAIGP